MDMFLAIFRTSCVVVGVKEVTKAVLKGFVKSLVGALLAILVV